MEHLAEGSSKSLIIIHGTNHEEIDVSGVLRPILYVEGQISETLAFIHVFCPKLNREGEWSFRVAIWSKMRSSLSTNVDLLDFCQVALIGTPVKVAWALSQGERTFTVIFHG